MATTNIYEISNFVFTHQLELNEGPIEVIKAYKANIVILGFRTGGLKMVDVVKDKVLMDFGGHNDLISSLMLLELDDNKLLISGSRDKDIRVWNLETGECISVLKGHTGGVLDVTATENHIISCSEDTTIKIWNLEDSSLLHTLTGHKRKVSKVEMLSDTQVLSAAWDHTIAAWDIIKGNRLWTLRGHFDAIDAMDLRKNYAITGDHSGFICLWNIKKQKQELLYQFQAHEALISDVCIAHKSFYSGSKDKTVKKFDFRGNCLKRFEGSNEAILSVNKQANLLFIASAGGRVNIWDDNSKNSFKHRELTGKILDIDYNKTLQKFATAGTDNVIRIWNKRGKKVNEFQTAYDSWIWGVAFFDNNKIVTSSDQGRYRMYQANTGVLLKEFEGHKSATYRVSVNEKRNVMVTNSWDNTARVWNIDTGDCLTVLKGHTYAVYSSYITDEKIVTGSSDGTLRIWDYDGNCLQVIRAHKGEIFHIAGEGNTVVTASDDKTIRAYNIDTYESLVTLKGHKDQVWSVAIKNGIVFSGSLAQTIKVWDLKNKACLKTFQGHTDGVKDLAISSGSENILVSCDYSGNLLFWDVSKFMTQEPTPSAGCTPSEREEQDILLAQIQMGRAYGIISEELGDPEISRLVTRQKPLTTVEHTDQHIISTLRSKVDSWRKLGRIGYAPWLNEIPKLVADNQLQLNPEETVDTMLRDLTIGIRESEQLYYLGLLRTMGITPETLLPHSWSFELAFSGKGPNPLDLDFEWQPLGATVNLLRLQDRRETALVFKLTLKNLPVWLIPMIRSIHMEIKDDRGDIETIIFTDFLPSDDGEEEGEGDWYDIGMFKIDAGYSLEPRAEVHITDIRVIYEEDLMPNIETSQMLEHIRELQQEQIELQRQIKQLNLSMKKIKKDDGLATPEQEEEMELSEPSNGQQEALKSLRNSSQSKRLFEHLKNKFKRPQYGTLDITIGGSISFLDKFLESIQPKFILLTFGTSIVSVTMLALSYIYLYGGINLLGQPLSIVDYNLSLTSTEVAIYIGVYGILVLILLYSIFSWLRYQTRRHRLR